MLPIPSAQATYIDVPAITLLRDIQQGFRHATLGAKVNLEDDPFEHIL
jgi:hypothetical protein